MSEQPDTGHWISRLARSFLPPEKLDMRKALEHDERTRAMRCVYWDRPQPSNMRSYNEHPLCLACADRLELVGPSTWRHESYVDAEVERTNGKR